MTIREFIKLSHVSGLPLVEYIKQLPEKKFLYREELLSEIRNARENGDSDYLERLLLISLRDGVDSHYTKILCELLVEKWHESHEDIVMLLEDIKDPNSIDVLYETAIDIPDYDDGRSLAKKCIWALGKIATLDAKMRLQMLSKNNDAIIKEAALKELEQLL